MNARTLVCRWSWKKLQIVAVGPRTLTYNTKFSSRGSERQFVVFYRWPNMRLLRVLSRLKVYQVLTMMGLLCPFTYWYNVGSVSSYILWCAYTSTLGVTAMLCTISYWFSRVVGELSYCQQSDTVQLSTLTFMGRRRDFQLPAHAIVPFSDSHHGQTKFLFQKLDIIEPQSVYYYSIQYGHVLDWDLMKKVLEIYE